MYFLLAFGCKKSQPLYFKRLAIYIIKKENSFLLFIRRILRLFCCSRVKIITEKGFVSVSCFSFYVVETIDIEVVHGLFASQPLPHMSGLPVCAADLFRLPYRRVNCLKNTSHYYLLMHQNQSSNNSRISSCLIHSFHISI